MVDLSYPNNLKVISESSAEECKKSHEINLEHLARGFCKKDAWVLRSRAMSCVASLIPQSETEFVMESFILILNL